MLKKIIILTIIITLFLSVFLHLSFNPDFTSKLIRVVASYDLKKRGIYLRYKYTPIGIQNKPFLLDFGNRIEKLSRGKIILDVINTYTIGSMDKDPSGKIHTVNNFLDPTSKFKDAWFGAYIVFDDPSGRGRRFFLKNPEGRPDSYDNFNINSISELPKLDQMLIVLNTHKNQKGFNEDKFMDTFPFDKNLNYKFDLISDEKNRSWYKITSAFDTISALTDTSITDMTKLYTIRGFVGLPDEKVYALVSPWHRITIKGSVITRYFNCPKVKFWCVVYYNGTSFINKKGEKVDTWENTDIQDEFYKMFTGLEIECVE
ncbi:MAG: hypothetical protein WBN66_00315 [Smithella sp.]